MAAYLIARVEVLNPHLLRKYMAATPPIIAKYNGRFLARGGDWGIHCRGRNSGRLKCRPEGSRLLSAPTETDVNCGEQGR